MVGRVTVSAARGTGGVQVAGTDADVNRFIAAYIKGLANRLANGASNHYRTRFGMGMSEWRAMMAIGTSRHRIVREVAEMADLDYAAARRGCWRPSRPSRSRRCGRCCAASSSRCPT